MTITRRRLRAGYAIHEALIMLEERPRGSVARHAAVAISPEDLAAGLSDLGLELAVAEDE